MAELRNLDELKQVLKNKYKASDKIERLFYPENPLPLENCYLHLALIEEKVIKQLKEDAETDKYNNADDLSHREHFLREYERIQHIQRKLDVKDILSECETANKRIYIEGAAGAGKSTLSRYLAYQWATDQAPWNQYEWVFYIRLRELSPTVHASAKKLLEMVDGELFVGDGNHLKPNEFTEFCSAVQSRPEKVLWILDGYDELNAEIAICQWWKDLLASNYHLLITSRPGSQLIKRELNINLNLAVLGFSDEQIEKYIQNFFNSEYTPDTKPGDATQCLKGLKSNSNLWSLSHTPIQLEMLCSNWSDLTQQKDLPLAQLYRIIAEKLFKRRAIHEGLHPEELETKVLKARYADYLTYMEYLAFLGMQAKEIVLTETQINEAYKILPKDKHKQADFYNQLKKLGLLKRYNGGKSAEFAHLTFQEYFAARFIAKAIKAFSMGEVYGLTHELLVKFVAATKGDSFYEVMYWFIAGLLASKSESQAFTIYKFHGKEEIIQDLAVPKQHQRLQTLQLFFDLLLQAPRAELEAFELPLLLKCLVEANMPAIMQKQALELHAQYWIKNYIKDQDLFNKTGLKKLFNTVKTTPLMQLIIIGCLKKDYSDGMAVAKVIGTLGVHASEELQQALVTLVEEYKDEYMRRAVARAISALGVHASEGLRQALLTLVEDKDAYVRKVVAEAIGALGMHASEELRQALLTLVKDESKYVREAVAEAIGALGMHASEELQQALLTLVKDKSVTVRWRVAEAIGALGANASGKLQQGLLTLVKDEDVCGAVAKAIGALGMHASEELQQGLLTLVKDENAYVRRSVAWVIGELGMHASEELRQALLTLVKDKSGDVRGAVAEAIGVLGMHASEELQQALLTLVKDENNFVRAAVARAIGALGIHASEELQQGLLTLVKDENKDVLKAVADAIGALGMHASEELRQVLLTLVKDEDVFVRETVAEAIGALGIHASEELRQALLTLVKDESVYVRLDVAYAIGALGMHASEELRQALLTLVKDESVYVRKAVAYAIGALGMHASEELQQALLILVNAESIYVRQAVARAIGALGMHASEELQQALLQLSKNIFTQVRFAAAEVRVRNTSGLVIYCKESFNDLPVYIPPSHLIQTSADIVKVDAYGKLDCLPLCGNLLENIIRDSGSLILDADMWTLAIVRKKMSNAASSSSIFKSVSRSYKTLTSHAFFILEGVKDGVRFAKKIDLFAIGGTGSQSSGQAVSIEIIDIDDFKRLQQLANNCVAMVWSITKTQGAQLLKNIASDQAKAERGEIIYNQAGDGSLFGSKQKHSCISWCLEKWQQLGLPLKRKWYDVVVVVPSAYLEVKKESCSVM